jgi:hypothetical protein
LPQFCRHNRFFHLCPICARENAPPGTPPAPRRPAPGRTGTGTARRGATRTRTARGLQVHRLERAADDGYNSSLAPGLRASEDAARLADELAFATGRLALLAADPPGLWAEVAAHPDAEEAIWLAFLISLLAPLEADDPWTVITGSRSLWTEASAVPPADVETGPRGSYDAARGAATIAGYRAWVLRAGSQAAALGGEAVWTPERRFARAFERLALPGLHRGARFDFLATLGAVGRIEMTPAALGFTGGGDATVVGAKRAFGIGDPMLLERRAAGLAEAAEVPLAALDLALASWENGSRIHAGVPDSALDADAAKRARSALGV